MTCKDCEFFGGVDGSGYVICWASRRRYNWNRSPKLRICRHFIPCAPQQEGEPTYMELAPKPNLQEVLKGILNKDTVPN